MGLNVQYLIWVIPFAILCRQRWFLATFTAAAGTFMIFFFRMPIVNAHNFENLATFGMLKPFGAWTPPVASPSTQPAIVMLGNYGIPLLSLMLIVSLLIRVVRRGPVREETAGPTLPLIVPAALLVTALIIATAATWLMPDISAKQFEHRMKTELTSRYDVVEMEGKGVHQIRQSVWIPRAHIEQTANPTLNLSNLLLAWTFGSAILAAAWRPAPESNAA